VIVDVVVRVVAWSLFFLVLLVAVVYWAGLCARFADSGCTCAKGRWDPECPRHGRKAAW